MLVWLFILVLEVLGVVGRIKSVDLSPGGQMPHLPRVRRSKCKGEDYLNVFSIRKPREKERKRLGGALVFIKSTVPSSGGCEESDDQYRTCDLRTSGPGTVSRIKQVLDIGYWMGMPLPLDLRR